MKYQIKILCDTDQAVEEILDYFEQHPNKGRVLSPVNKHAEDKIKAHYTNKPAEVEDQVQPSGSPAQ